MGLPECPFLQQSRIPSRWTLDYDPPADIIADPHGLPFGENAVDLIVMPHALEFTDDPHLMLREAYRVIRPEGQIVLSGFNPFSLYGAKRYFGRAQTPPWNGNFIALYRLKDWLTLLGFDVVGGRLDGYAPPFRNEKWLQPMRVLRVDRRSLVADRRRCLLPARDQARAGDARADARLAAARTRRKVARARAAPAKSLTTSDQLPQ